MTNCLLQNKRYILPDFVAVEQDFIESEISNRLQFPDCYSSYIYSIRKKSVPRVLYEPTLQTFEKCTQLDLYETCNFPISITASALALTAASILQFERLIL